MTALVMTVHLAMSPSAIAQEAEAALPQPASVARSLLGYIQSVQHPTTGLPPSFTKSLDHALKDVAFTYDVALASLILAHGGSLTEAKRALNTYLRMPLPAQRTFEHFNTAYSIVTHRPTLEYQIHGGPIFWMAIAFMRYAQATGDRAALEQGIRLLEWAQNDLPHDEGGVAMSHIGPFTRVMSVENNWAYYAALRIATSLLSDGARRERLRREQVAVRRWLTAHATDRGRNDAVQALDVYTHALLVGPVSYLEDGVFGTREELHRWAKAHVARLETLFQLPGAPLYDYTDHDEVNRIGRGRLGWLEGTEQASVAYQTWVPWFEQQGDLAFAKELGMKASLAHHAVLRHQLPVARSGIAIPNTNAVLSFRTFHDGWYARPRSEPALNGTSWAYFAEVGYNPFVMAIPQTPEGS